MMKKIKWFILSKLLGRCPRCKNKLTGVTMQLGDFWECFKCGYLEECNNWDFPERWLG